jgi:predicted nucleic acid-binding protein
MTFGHAIPAVVVDASVASDLVNGDEAWLARWRGWRRAHALLLAPPHFRLEVANALLRGQRQPPEVVARALELLFDTGVSIADRGLDGVKESLELASRHGLTAYDASYLQLALDTDAEIATLDRDLARAARDEGLIVHE